MVAQEILLQDWEESSPDCDKLVTLDDNMNSSCTGLILSSFAVEMGLATKEDPGLPVDQAKVAREQEREMTRLIGRAEDWMRSSGIDAVLFDGKDEKAKAWVTLPCGTKVIRHVKEDHISLMDR